VCSVCKAYYQTGPAGALDDGERRDSRRRSRFHVDGAIRSSGWCSRHYYGSNDPSFRSFGSSLAPGNIRQATTRWWYPSVTVAKIEPVRKTGGRTTVSSPGSWTPSSCVCRSTCRVTPSVIKTELRTLFEGIGLQALRRTRDNGGRRAERWAG